MHTPSQISVLDAGRASLLAFAIAVLLSVGASLVMPSTSTACGPPLSPGTYNLGAEEIFAGRVLERTPLEHRVQDGQALTLYQVSVLVSDNLKGSTFAGQLVTIYVIACTLPEDLSESTYDESTLVLTALYDVPSAPDPLTSYIFYARSFGETEFVLYDNSNMSIQETDEDDVEQARFNISQGYYGY